MEVTSGHKRSKSDPVKRRVKEDNLDNPLETPRLIKLDMGQLKSCVETKKKESPNTEVRNSLKQEILQPEKRLQDQFGVRCELENALGYSSSSRDTMAENSMPKPAKELIKEIAVLELEVLCLEQYLLSLYRKAFDQQVSSLSTSNMDEKLKSPSSTQQGMFMGVSRFDITPKREKSTIQSSHLLFSQDSLGNLWKESNGTEGAENLLDSGIHRTYSSLSQRSARISPPMGTLTKSVRVCHSQPLSSLEYAQSATSKVISLAEHLSTRISDYTLDTPNRLSEDIIKSISAIYCKLANIPLMHQDVSSSPIASLLSMSAFSPQYQNDIWSPQCRKDSSLSAQLDNPFCVEGLKEFSGPYSTMVEVPWICRDSQKLIDIGHMLQNFRSLVFRLEEVDARKMKHEEKLAFWINIHNALVMHVVAFLAYGIPQNNMKRVSLILKAAYNVGGHTISVDKIQSSILGCRTPRPGQWLRFLFSPRMKFRARDDRQAYAIGHPEPLLHFALCSGSYSDPAVRIYTTKSVFQELEAAKEEYIQATFAVRKEQKILLPKIVESFAKDSDLCQMGVVEMIQQCVPKTQRKSIRRCQQGRSRKSIEWVPHNFTFRYLFSKELVT
ncbi:hypothetical protein HHK36_010048 [Tetracentron sinense]|uniref:Uncharacterized protein n=1 Tax=Tetracentron sinense TaxID=13715 RepID=A0A834ZG83_TETSI|nr:hypothetical protein HHK36_010048 [Tetracentron sinense]